MGNLIKLTSVKGKCSLAIVFLKILNNKTEINRFRARLSIHPDFSYNTINSIMGLLFLCAEARVSEKDFLL